MDRSSTCMWISLLAVLFADTNGAADADVWQPSINLQTKERYIPVELWAGVEWDGNRDLAMPAVDGTYRHRTATYQIKGPLNWKHPATGEIAVVYERTNPGNDGVKLQLFTINQDRSGLGRLFDGRPQRDTRTASGGLKFPLGLWQEQEKRSFSYRMWDSARQGQRTETITITEINFDFEKTRHCLRFDWMATEQIRSKTVTHDRQTYIYCPAKSMVSQIRH